MEWITTSAGNCEGTTKHCRKKISWKHLLKHIQIHLAMILQVVFFEDHIPFGIFLLSLVKKQSVRILEKIGYSSTRDDFDDSAILDETISTMTSEGLEEGSVECSGYSEECMSLAVGAAVSLPRENVDRIFAAVSIAIT